MPAQTLSCSKAMPGCARALCARRAAEQLLPPRPAEDTQKLGQRQRLLRLEKVRLQLARRAAAEVVDRRVSGTRESLAGQTVGVVKGSASAKVLRSVIPGIALKPFTTPADALAAFNAGEVNTLGGGTLWLAANSSASSTDLVPLRPYGRAGIGCIVSQNNGRLLSSANIALGQMMQAYVDGDAGTREMVNRWIGPTSSVKLTETAITGLYSLILSTTAEMSTSVKAGS